MSARFTRRHFLKTIAATATTSVFFSPSKPGKTAIPLLKPASLKPGSVVGIVSPVGGRHLS